MKKMTPILAKISPGENVLNYRLQYFGWEEGGRDGPNYLVGVMNTVSPDNLSINYKERDPMILMCVFYE